MEFKQSTERKPTIVHSAATNVDLTNVTVLSTPRPQASSTIERKSVLGRSLQDRTTQDDKCKRSLLDDSDDNRTTQDSSLGILDNISSLLDDSSIIEERQSFTMKSKINTERELARKLLQRCSELKATSSFSEVDKENNVNLQNVVSDPILSTLDDSSNHVLQMRLGSQETSNLPALIKKSISNVSFEPNEITARSSGMSKSSERCLPSTSLPSSNGISFGASTAELMTQFNDEEFQSGSQAGSRILSDELSWQQNCSHIVPNVDKERLELSCFSGFIGDLDVSIESNAGRKVSVGEFFRRKCGNIGQLVDVEFTERPSIGVSIVSPKKHGKLMPLVDVTVSSEASFVNRNTDRSRKSSLNVTDYQEERCITNMSSITQPSKDIESGSSQQDIQESKMSNTTECSKEHSIMSISSIAQALKDTENGSPRRLVDQLLMAKKKKKCPPLQMKRISSDTYTLSAIRNSMPVASITRIETPEKDTTLFRHSAKLSLDSKVISDNKFKLSNVSLNSDQENITTRTNLCDIDISEGRNKKGETDEEITSNAFIHIDKVLETFSVEHSNVARKSLNSTDDLKFSQENVSFQDQTKSNKESIKEPKLIPNLVPLPPFESALPTSYLAYYSNEKNATTSQESKLDVKCVDVVENTVVSDIQKIKRSESMMCDVKLESNVITEYPGNQKQVQPNRSAVVVKNTQEMYICVVGIPMEAEIEILNKGDRWIMCSLCLHQIQGDKESVNVDLPADKILIKPDSRKSVKMGIRVSKMGKPIIVVLNVAISDMVTRSNWSMKHIICFIPEELQINVLTQFGKEELNFQTVAENCSKSLPIQLENKNNMDFPIKLCIVNDGPELFSINSKTSEAANSYNETEYLILKPGQQFTTNIQFKGVPLTSLKSGVMENGSFRVTANLIVRVCLDKDEEPVIKKVPLIGYIGICKIEVVDTQLPIIISEKQSKSLNLINAGNISVPISASVVESDDSHKLSTDFSLIPDKLFLQSGERGTISVTYNSQNTDTSKRYAVIEITAGSSKYFYSVIGEESQITEQESDNFLRCDTPLHTDSMCSPTSPHSSVSNRSGNYGRISPASSVSARTVSGDVIPIRATHAALVWSSVKVGKTDTKEFTIRNTSNNKIKLQAYIVDNDKCFKFLRERQAVCANMLLSLQPMESRTLSIVFGPNNSGAAAGKILFKHYAPKKNGEESRPTKVIFLYGYGGTGKVEISEAFKDIGRQMWLSLGCLNAGGTLNAKIKLENTGDLCSYAKIKLVPKALYPAMVTSWHVDPVELLLGPGEVQWVNLEFHPRKEDLVLLHRADVSHVGTLTITHGDEPTRWRIRRLYSKLKETGQLSGKENETFRNIVYPICKVFPGETLIQDLSIIHDSVQNLGDLCRGVSQHEVMLTLEVNVDETMSIFHDNANDTQMFYSLCSDSSSLFAAAGDSFMPSETLIDTNHGQMYEDNFTVNLSLVTLAPPFRNEATVMISSLCSVAQPFETILTNTEFLSVVPSEGMIPSRRNFPLKIQCKKQIDRDFEAILQVYIENDKREILIKVTCNRK